MTDYKTILKSVGYPENILVLDFETYLDTKYTLKKMSIIEYIKHPKFAFTGLGLWNGLSGFGDEIEFIEPYDIKWYLELIKWGEITVIVKNAKFDITILKEKFNFVPKYIIDIEDLSRHLDSREKHSLKNLAKRFKFTPKGDTMQFKGLHWEDMTPEQRKAMIKYSNTDCRDEFELFKILLPKLTNPKIELALAQHTLDLYLNPKIDFDFGKAIELKTAMNKKLDSIIKRTGYFKKTLSGNKSFTKAIEELLPIGETIPLKVGRKGMIPAIAKQDDGCQYLLTHSNPQVRELMEARLAIRSWPLHLKRINNMTNQAIAYNGKLPVNLRYYGGHTGRWSGAGGINLQNLGGRGRAGAGVDPLISGMRSLLRAPEGYSFLIADSAQIEARVLAWMAGEKGLLEDFKNGKSPYCTLASKLFKTQIHKPIEEEKKTKEGQIMAIKYGFGKDGILGCGYGMGAAKFHQRCLENPSLRPSFDSSEYDFIFIKKLIDTYRTTYKSIPRFWKETEKVFKIVVKYPYEKRYYSNFINPESDRPLLSFSNHNGTVHLQLPSGRILYYHNVRIAEAGGYSIIQYKWGHLWGGSIVENIIQAVARDLLGYWILEFEKAGLPVVLTSHDEIVSLVPKTDSEPCLNIASTSMNVAINIMRSSPDWAEGLPLDAEGEISEVYKK